MPMLYGEGEVAFIRLQEEIMKITEDYSILAWFAHSYEEFHPCLATSPSDFCRPKICSTCKTRKWEYSDIVVHSPADFRKQKQQEHKEFRTEDVYSLPEPPSLTGRGLRITLPLRLIEHGEYIEDSLVAYIHCQIGPEKKLLCIYFRPSESDPSLLSRTWRWGLDSSDALHEFNSGLVYIDRRVRGLREQDSTMIRGTVKLLPFPNCLVPYDRKWSALKEIPLFFSTRKDAVNGVLAHIKLYHQHQSITGSWEQPRALLLAVGFSDSLPWCQIKPSFSFPDQPSSSFPAWHHEPEVYASETGLDTECLSSNNYDDPSDRVQIINHGCVIACSLRKVRSTPDSALNYVLKVTSEEQALDRS
jgi:hypothetical protein